MKEKLVSIITPVYNSEKFLKQSIESVLAQTYKNWELRIVDDCSTDNSKQILTKYANFDRRIKPLFLKKNSGAGLARNEAIKLAKGKIIAFLDSDDIWLSTKLEEHISFMQGKNAAFSHGSYGFINETGKIINKTYRVSNRAISYQDLLKKTEISCLTAMYDVEKLGKMYMPDLRVKQDYALWLSILKRGFVSIPIDRELAFYRIRRNSNTNNKLKLIIKHFKFLYNFEKLSALKTFYYTSWWAINGGIKLLYLKFKKRKPFQEHFR